MRKIIICNNETVMEELKKHFDGEFICLKGKVIKSVDTKVKSNIYLNHYPFNYYKDFSYLELNEDVDMLRTLNIKPNDYIINACTSDIYGILQFAYIMHLICIPLDSTSTHNVKWFFKNTKFDDTMLSTKWLLGFKLGQYTATKTIQENMDLLDVL